MSKTLEERTLSSLFSSIETEMKGIMQARGMNATGRTRDSIRYEVRGNKGTLFGAEHLEFVERGRGPGKFPPIKEIEDWCIAKGIPVEAAYPIATIIARKGTQLHRRGEKSGVLSKTITDKRIKLYVGEYLKEKGTEIRGKYADLLKDK